MAADKTKINWKIQNSDNHGSFPVGEIQKLKQIDKTDSYELKWKAGQVDCSFAPLFADPNNPDILSNPNAVGRHGAFEAIYDVRVVITPTPGGGKERLLGSSAEKLRASNTPAPLVGQWGAETPPPPGVTRVPPSPVAVENDR